MYLNQRKRDLFAKGQVSRAELKRDLQQMSMLQHK